MEKEIFNIEGIEIEIEKYYKKDYDAERRRIAYAFKAYQEVVEDGHPILIVSAVDIAGVLRKNAINSSNVDFLLLVGGFPCQDYSVASFLATAKDLEGKKGVLWRSIRDILEEKKPPFVLRKNIDRLFEITSKSERKRFWYYLCLFQRRWIYSGMTRD